MQQSLSWKLKHTARVITREWFTENVYKPRMIKNQKGLQVTKNKNGREKRLEKHSGERR